MEQMTPPAPKRINIQTIKRLLNEGFTRYERQNRVEDGYGYGSIEQYYGLTPTDVRNIFQDERIKGLKTKVPTYVLVDEPEDERIVLIDEDEEEDEEEFVKEKEIPVVETLIAVPDNPAVEQTDIFDIL